MNRISESVTSLEHLLIHYIDLAKTSTETFQKSGKTKDIRFKDLQKVKRFDECLIGLSVLPAVLTISHKLKRNMDYSDIVTTLGFLPSFSITDNGISRPKIITCQVSEDGNSDFYFVFHVYVRNVFDLID